MVFFFLEYGGDEVFLEVSGQTSEDTSNSRGIMERRQTCNLFRRVPPVRGVLIVTVTERDVLVLYRRDFILAQARPFGIPPDILYHLFRAFPEVAQMDNPLLLVYHMFDKAHELHAVAEVMFELSVVGRTTLSEPYRTCVFEYASDESVIHL